MEKTPLTLKGTQQGILLQPKSPSWAEVLQGLEHALQDARSFFQGGRVILGLGTRGLSREEFVSLRDILDKYEMELWAVLSTDKGAIRTARAHGIRTRLPGSEDGTTPSEDPQANAQFVRRTLRSGQRIQYPGNVVLVGDVHPGAEIVAGGNIVVWGKLLGMAHAGAMGDEAAVICALELAPSQIRIAGYISRAPDEKRRRKLQPEMASVRDHRIIAEPYTPSKIVL
jgi:septum site-determining protein MinC